MPIDGAGIERLIRAGSSPRFETPLIDREALAADLRKVQETYQLLCWARELPTSSTLLAELRSISSALRKILRHIDGHHSLTLIGLLGAAAELHSTDRDPSWRASLAAVLGNPAAGTPASVRLLADWATIAIEIVQSGKSGFIRIRDLPADYVYGHALPAVYETHFLRKFAVSCKKDGQLIGPGVRFVETAAEAIGVYKPDGTSYDASVIRNAIRRLSRT